MDLDVPRCTLDETESPSIFRAKFLTGASLEKSKSSLPRGSKSLDRCLHALVLGSFLYLLASREP
eukprot:scaffold67753_cov66-Cyclotella_meneghiniana.AAC.7